MVRVTVWARFILCLSLPSIFSLARGQQLACELLGWGDNNYGQYQVLTNKSTSGLLAVSAGQTFTIGLNNDGKLVGFGQFGFGVGKILIPAGLPRIKLQTEGHRTVSAGLQHWLAVSETGSVIAWGDNTYGQCTIPATYSDVIEVAAGYYKSYALHRNGTVTSWGRYPGLSSDPDRDQDNCASLRNVKAISAGMEHMLVLYADGTVAVRGTSKYSLKNVPPDLGPVEAIAAGKCHNLVRSSGKLRAWGDNSWGQGSIPIGFQALEVRSFDAGAYHNVALTEQGKIVTWGRDNSDLLRPPVAVATAKRLLAVEAGSYHSVALSQGLPQKVEVLRSWMVSRKRMRVQMSVRLDPGQHVISTSLIVAERAFLASTLTDHYYGSTLANTRIAFIDIPIDTLKSIDEDTKYTINFTVLDNGLSGSAIGYLLLPVVLVPGVAPNFPDLPSAISDDGDWAELEERLREVGYVGRLHLPSNDTVYLTMRALRYRRNAASFAEGAELLNMLIAEILNSTYAKRVRLVAHSKGTLVTRQYFQNYGSDNVANAILVQGPHSGALTPLGFATFISSYRNLWPIYPYESRFGSGWYTVPDDAINSELNYLNKVGAFGGPYQSISTLPIDVPIFVAFTRNIKTHTYWLRNPGSLEAPQFINGEGDFVVPYFSQIGAYHDQNIVDSDVRYNDFAAWHRHGGLELELQEAHHRSMNSQALYDYLVAYMGVGSSVAENRLSVLGLDKTAVVGGFEVDAFVAVQAEVQGSPARVTMTMDGKSLETVSLNVGSRVKRFRMATPTVLSEKTVAVTATWMGNTVEQPLVLKPGGIQSFKIRPASAVGGASFSGTVLLSAPAPIGSGGRTVRFASNSSLLKVRSADLVPEGLSSMSVTISSLPVGVATEVGVSATVGVVTKTAVVTLNP